MCLIVYKPAGVSMPTDDQMSQWFKTFPDGFGLSFPYRGRVRTIKGAMTEEDMFGLIIRASQQSDDSSADTDFVIQFRAAATGKPCPRFCHPFPVSKNQDELDALDVVSEAALAHNGIITGYGSGYGEVNDAQEFVKEYIADLYHLIPDNPSLGKMIADFTNSKFALITSGRISLMGEFIYDKGLWYSNPGYLSKESYLNYMYPKNIKPYNSKEDVDNGCDLCHDKSGVLYWTDDGSLLCRSCYERLEGRNPEADDLYISHMNREYFEGV